MVLQKVQDAIPQMKCSIWFDQIEIDFFLYNFIQLCKYFWQVKWSKCNYRVTLEKQVTLHAAPKQTKEGFEGKEEWQTSMLTAPIEIMEWVMLRVGLAHFMGFSSKTLVFLLVLFPCIVHTAIMGIQQWTEKTLAREREREKKNLFSIRKTPLLSPLTWRGS